MNHIVERFLQNMISAQTRRAYKHDIENFLKFVDYKIDNITFETIVDYRDLLQDKGLAPASINRNITSIRSLLTWCVNIGYLKENPALRVKLPKAEVQRPTLAFTDREVVKMLNIPDNSLYGQMHKIMLSLLFTLGLRRSELASLKVKDIVEDRDVYVLRIRGKGQKLREVPLTAPLKKQMDELINTKNLMSDDYLFQFIKNMPVNPSSVNRMVIRYAKKAGINRRVTAHSCRATVISHLLEKGVSPRDVADLVGHASINTTVEKYDKKRDKLTNSAVYKVKFNS